MPEQATSKSERFDGRDGYRDWDTVAEEYNLRHPDRKQITAMAARMLHQRAINKLRAKLAGLLEEIQ